MRTLYLPATRKTISLRAYLDGYAMVKANPTATFSFGLTTWWPGISGAEILEQYRAEFRAVINRRGGEDWRNERTERDIAYYRDARAANGRCIIRRFETRKANRRLAHRLYTEDDF